ncbi:cadherin-89D [Condylostylus longicornis]|uniref:cadherin-89D n=1 Tax=Condylostylus longicornis TaxID=2530218 RepID=UPI00244E09DB|nr:cadherin-89D [Condylostylus longicornis]
MNLTGIKVIKILIWITFLIHCVTKACVFHSQDGTGTEAEGVRFIRVREDLTPGKEIVTLRAYPRTSIMIRGIDRSTDHKFFKLLEINSTTVQILLEKSLEDLVDRDIPQNLLKFRIFCTGHNGRHEEAAYLSVTVYVEDVNDHAPVFLNQPYTVRVDESTSPGTVIFQGIQAVDRDKPNTPNSDVQITLIESDRHLGAPYFMLESPHRPFVILKRQLDYDNGVREFNIPIIASDRGSPPRYANTSLQILVKDNDDLPPKFTEGVYRTKINEFYPMTGKAIRVPLYFAPPVMAFDQDSLNASLIYDIISGNERKLFKVNPQNGIIYLEREIDLEEESLPGNTFVLQIEARQKDSPLKRALARIEIEILDLNDNAPEFEVELYNISIVENLPSGFSVLQVNAVDRDQGENSEFFYTLINEKPSGAFLIDSRTGWLTVRDHTLLDREARSSISMTVQAVERNHPYDTERPKDSGTVLVEITLLDSNDNTPKFENGNLYEFKVSVAAIVNTVIGKVTAKDPDEGRNGLILYELQRPKGSGYIPFRLDSQTGTLFVAGPLRRGRIALFVEASDQPTNPSEKRFSLAVVTIEVHPIINEDTIDFIGAPYEFWVGADVPVGTSVGQVRTTLDYDGDADIMYDLLHSYPEGVPFAIEERSGIVTVIRDLEDFDRNVYYFEAGVISDSEDVLVTNVTIHVVGPNDDRGILMRGTSLHPIEFHIKENVPGALIGRLLYKHADKPIGLRFLIANQQDVTNRITIMDDGTLMTLSGLDRETQEVYRLTIIAEYSKGFISGAGIYQVNVIVDDVNDNPPVFDAPVYSGVIYENSPVGSEIILNRPIVVTDADAGKNALFNLSFIGEGKDMFKIEFYNVTGKKNLTAQFTSHEQLEIERNFIDMQMILLNPNRTISNEPHYRVKYVGAKTLDREREHFYNLHLLAKDSGGLTSSVRLHILIADVNDNPPVFEKIAVFKESGVEIIEYSNDMEVYFVEKMTGEKEKVKVLQMQDFSLPGSPRYSTLNFTRTGRSRRGEIHKQFFRQGKKLRTSPFFAVLEDVPVGTTVLKVTATDEDSDKNSQIFYEITTETIYPILKTKDTIPLLRSVRFFNIDRISGEIKVNQPLEANVEILLNLTAKDIGGLSDHTSIRFRVVDVNNHAPVFKKSWYSFDLQEGEYYDQSIDRIEATDDDFGQNANVTYSIESPDPIPFHISHKSGVLKVDGDLDREVKSQYEFLIIASDNAINGKRLSSSVEVEINVLDVNDNSPEFVGYDEIMNAQSSDQINELEDARKMVSDDTYHKYSLLSNTPVYKAYLHRNTVPGTFVKQITAIDKDYAGNGNGLVMFSLLHHKMPHLFEIDSRDGIITTISKFNKYNGYDHVNLTVVATDLGSPSKSSTAFLTVNLQGDDLIEEEDSNLFHHKYYEVEVLENNDYPLDLIKINVSAAYVKEPFKWSIVPEYGEQQNSFEIDEHTGVIRVTKSLDREEIEAYRLKIRADRVGREARTYTQMMYPVSGDRIQGLQENEVRVVIRVGDENDNTPKFRGNGRPIVTIIPNTANFGFPVTTVEAIDNDIGLNAEIRYKLLNEPTKMFGINEETGKIRVLGPISGERRVYGFDVKATDRRGDDDGRSSIANVFVYVLDENRQVRLVVSGKPLTVERHIGNLMKNLSVATGMDVRVRLLEPHFGGEVPATDVYIYAVDPKTNTIVDMEKLQKAISSIDMQNMSVSSSSQILEIADFGTLPPRINSKSVGTATMSGTEIISIILAIIVFAGGMTTSLCILCVRYKRKRPPGTGIAYAVGRLPSSTLGTSANSKTTVSTTAGGSTNSKRAIRDEIIRQSNRSQLFGGYKTTAKGILTSYDQRQQSYFDGALAKAIIVGNTIVEHESSPSRYTQIHNHNTNLSPKIDASMQSHHSSSRDSGIGFITTSRERSDTPSEHLLRVIRSRQSMVKAHTKCSCPDRMEMHNCCAGDSRIRFSDSYEDSLKNGEITTNTTCSHQNFTMMPSNSINTNHLHHHGSYQQLPRFRRSYRNQPNGRASKRGPGGIRHSFSGVQDDLTQESPRIRSRVHSFRNSMTDLEKRLHNLEQSFRDPIRLNNRNFKS